MRTKKVRKDAAQRYLNALWHLYSKSEIITSMQNFSKHHQISTNFGRVLRQHNYLKKVNGQYVYTRFDAPTIHDAKFILKQMILLNEDVKATQSLPQPVVKKIVKKEKEPNVWMYLAVISMFTTLVTMALMLLR